MNTVVRPNAATTYKRLLSYLKDHKAMFALAFIGNLIYAAMDIAFIKALEPLTDKGLVGGDMEFMKMVPFFIIGIVLIRGFSGFVSTYCMSWIGLSIVQKMRQQLVDNYTQLPISFYDANSSGQLVSKITYNTQQVSAASTDALTKIFREGAFIIGTIAMLFYTNWQLAAIFFISIPLIGIIVKFASQRFKKISRRIQSAMGGVTQTSQEIVDGHKVIKTFGGQEYESKRFDVVATKNRRQMMKMDLTKAISTPLIQFIASFAIAGVIYYAASLLANKSLSPGEFIYMLSAMIALLKPLKVISNINNVIQQGITASESVFEIIDSDKEVDSGDKQLEGGIESISFQDINFSYKTANSPAVDQVSFEVAPGTTVALVGRSGSGKSTITSLLLRFYEIDSGNILINGQNIKDFTLTSLRQNIAYVSQQITLFNDSVAANIAYSVEKIDQQRLLDAATKAHALEFIQELPDGFNTLIGENGSRLSGGQKQRIAIARAIYKNASIIILDEATSALDTESERHIQAALDALTQNRTTLVIAHRLSTIENANSIVVMDAGKLVEQGTHQQLIAQAGYYAKLHALQFSDNEPVSG